MKSCLLPILLLLAPAAWADNASSTAKITFTRDVAPVLQKNCQTCHRPGEAAPFSMMSYKETRPWAKAIREAVLTRRMPPWFADPHYGRFSNDRSLSQKDIATIVGWVDAGAPEGDPADMPVAAAFTEGWAIPKPDVVFELPRAFDVPASGVIEYQHVIVPTGFTEDKWVQIAEARPTNRAVVHHVIAYVREPGSNYFKGQKPGEFFVAPQPKADGKVDSSALPSDFLVGYAPGQPPEVLAEDQAKLIKAGSDLVLEVHYTPNGKPTTDRTRIGLIFAKAPPKQRVMTLSATNGTFLIPPGDPNYRVNASFTVGTDVYLASLHPHMHTRGKDFEYRVVYPSGETKTLLRVPQYSWVWQLWYTLETPLRLPRGTKIECTAHFDNSANNPWNPDPAKAVRWGEQSFDEMMVGFFDLVFDAGMPVKELFQDTGTAGSSSL
ncbi:MAG TPA: cytochrome c [Bryobacteraceae bacterium]|nr:cytochrome c [Bryobacteraceae bacterium]